jgi:hypothetical protein
LEDGLDHFVFLNEDFREEYLKYLTLFSSELYIKSMFSDLEGEMNEQIKLIQSDFKNYSMDTSFYFEKAASIRNELVKMEEYWDQFDRSFSTGTSSTKPVYYKQRKDDLVLNEISLNAYLTKNEDSRYSVEIENYHLNPITVYGFSYSGTRGEAIPLEKGEKLSSFRKSFEESSIKIVLDKRPKRIFFKAENKSDSLMSKKLINWEKPGFTHPRIKLRNDFKEISPFYKVEGNTVVFGNESSRIDELIYIPSQYNVQFAPSASIDFVNGGGLIINNSLQIIGTDSKKIKLYSSDSSAMGITVIGAKHVEIENVEIIGFKTLDYDGWTLTGALTIYEADAVKISNLTISKNLSEDALNIVRSNFSIEKLKIEETFSDGFDADFCSGSLQSSVFRNTGNDCIDFSGSTVELNNILISNSGDKGISAGERSTVSLKNVKIDGAKIGVASKDESKVVGERLVLKNVGIDFMAFVKKPEYNKGAKIKLTQVQSANPLTTEWFELGSFVEINGKAYNGTEILNIEYP